VIHTESGWTCECPDHIFRHTCCKHIHAVEISIKLREQVRKQNTVTIEEIEFSNCPHCKSDNYIKKGVRHNQAGDIQRYFCNDCSKWFILNLGFERMKATPKAISSAMQLYFTGESLRNVQKFLRLQGVEVSHQTVYNWIQKYTNLMKKYLDTITPQVGDTWRADEVYVKIRGELKYVFSLMDDQTRFWIAQEVADRKQGHDASGLLRQGKEITGTKPKVFITDGLPSYAIASKKEFWSRERESRTTHIRHIHIQKDMNNNKMERLNGEFRDREKVARGLKKDESPLIDGYQLYHNFIRPHMALNGKTPSEVCGITVNGENKWKTLIQNSSSMKVTE
jgi:transposase-like protein